MYLIYDCLETTKKKQKDGSYSSLFSMEALESSFLCHSLEEGSIYNNDVDSKL